MSIPTVLSPIEARPLSDHFPPAPPDPLPELVRSLNRALHESQEYLRGNSSSYESVLLPTVRISPLPRISPLRPLKEDLNEHVLLDACYSAPDDNTPRLAYADWLQKRGHPEAADYIRIECGIWPTEEVHELRKMTSAALALEFWQSRFDGLKNRCLLSIPREPAKAPDVREKLPRDYFFRREFIRGLPSRVVIAGGRLLDLFHTCTEDQVLWLANDLWVPCNPDKTIHRGIYGNMFAHYRGERLSRLIREHLAQSKLIAPGTRTHVFP